MSSLLSDCNKAALQNVFYDIHDTFARPIVAFKTVTRVTVSTNPNYNPFYDAPAVNDVTQNITQSGIFYARIKYNAEEELNLIQGGPPSQVIAAEEDGVVRLKVDVTGAAYFFDTERVTFDDELFEVVTSKRPHGLFTPNFYTFYLKKLN